MCKICNELHEKQAKRIAESIGKFAKKNEKTVMSVRKLMKKSRCPLCGECLESSDKHLLENGFDLALRSSLEYECKKCRLRIEVKNNVKEAKLLLKKLRYDKCNDCSLG